MSTRELKYIFPVEISAEKAYELWTTKDGISSFFTDDNQVDFKPGGKFEMYFLPADKAQPGGRGGEGVSILAMEPGKMFSFTWNFPPTIPSLRSAGQLTCVHIFFEAVSDESCSVTFINSGYGTSEDWQQGLAYFARAWGQLVLPNFKYRAENGPVQNWEEVPRHLLPPIPAVT